MTSSDIFEGAEMSQGQGRVFCGIDLKSSNGDITVESDTCDIVGDVASSDSSTH